MFITGDKDFKVWIIYSDFWYEFEEALGDIDDGRVIHFFGTDSSDIEDIRNFATIFKAIDGKNDRFGDVVCQTEEIIAEL